MKNRLHSDIHGEKFYVDELGIVTRFKEPIDRVPLVENGLVDMDTLLRFSDYPDGVPIIEVCGMPRRKRNKYTRDWLASEYGAARRYMREMRKC